MIKVNKGNPPAALTQQSTLDATAELKRLFDTDASYAVGTKKFAINRNIYADASVKSELIGIQHDKCVFCESKISAVAFGDVEHFRPKGGVVLPGSSKSQAPGYYWLAYEWSNLFLGCQICNGTKNKGNKFPLVDETQRARSHHQSIQLEEPLLINAESDEPEDHITYDHERAVPANNSQKGVTTIKIMALNTRPALVDRRRDALADMDRILYILFHPAAQPVPQSVSAQINQTLDDIRSGRAEYAAMCRVYLRKVSPALV